LAPALAVLATPVPSALPASAIPRPNLDIASPDFSEFAQSHHDFFLPAGPVAPASGGAVSGPVGPVVAGVVVAGVVVGGGTIGAGVVVAVDFTGSALGKFLKEPWGVAGS
jgi:hypothetical protein